MSFQLLIGETIIDCDSKWMIGTKMIAQKVQGFLVKLYSFVHFFLLAVVFQ